MAQNGVLFSADMTRLVTYPATKPEEEYTVPDGVVSIGGAFDGCNAIKKITIPDTVTTIGKGAFSNCTSLQTLVVGLGVTSIEDEAFDNCHSLVLVQTDNEYVRDWFEEYFPDVDIYGMNEELPVLLHNTIIELKSGWNLVGIPFLLDEASCQALEAYRPFAFSSTTNGYVLAHEFTPGFAVWVFANQAKSLKLCGMLSAMTGVNLQEGWNMVSPIYRENDSAVSIQGLEVWSWNSNMYAPAENATYGTGYWLFSEQPQTIWE